MAAGRRWQNSSDRGVKKRHFHRYLSDKQNAQWDLAEKAGWAGT